MGLWDDFTDWVSDTAEDIGEAVDDAIDWVEDALGGTGSTLNTIVGTGLDIIDTAADATIGQELSDFGGFQEYIEENSAIHVDDEWDQQQTESMLDFFGVESDGDGNIDWGEAADLGIAAGTFAYGGEADALSGSGLDGLEEYTGLDLEADELTDTMDDIISSELDSMMSGSLDDAEEVSGLAAELDLDISDGWVVLDADALVALASL